MGQPRVNLRGVTTLLVDRDSYTRGLIVQMLRGFGIESTVAVDTGAGAEAHLKNHHTDLCIIEAVLPDMSGADLVRWIRRDQKEPARFIPILVLSGYTQIRTISACRDAGANTVLKKPVSPKALFDRITWMARVSRAFIEVEDYAGPDRRFKAVPPPDWTYKRAGDPASDNVVDLDAPLADEAALQETSA
jgi:CheY-like chemotaxis protein